MLSNIQICCPDLEVATGEHGHVYSLDEGDGQPLDPPDRAAVEGDSHQDWLAGAVHTVVQTYLTQQISLIQTILCLDARCRVYLALR